MSERAIVIVTVPASRVRVESFLALPLAGERVFWDASRLEPGEEWSFAGCGVTGRVEASGPRRIQDARARAETLLASVAAVPTGDDLLPSVRLFGGLSFQPRGEPTDPWTGFADASFVLPRWLYCASTKSGRAFVRLAVPARDWNTERERLVREMDEVVAFLARASSTAADVGMPQGSARLQEMTRPVWDVLVNEALESIRAHEFEKVVTARRSSVLLDRPIDLPATLHRMGCVEAQCVRFAFERAGAVFLGATPERLAAVHGLRIEADALAGSIARRGRDVEEIHALFASEKDQREHALVVRGICEALDPFASSASADGPTRVRSLRAVHHLWTPVVATLHQATHVLELVDAVHPTPAVCGTPREPARGWIASHEPSSRGWYASPVGWFDAEGNGSFAVAIRSALVRQRDAWLFAGAGIVEGSDPALEYRETGVKQTTMMATLGVAS